MGIDDLVAAEVGVQCVSMVVQAQSAADSKYKQQQHECTLSLHNYLH